MDWDKAQRVLAMIRDVCIIIALIVVGSIYVRVSNAVNDIGDTTVPTYEYPVEGDYEP